MRERERERERQRPSERERARAREKERGRELCGHRERGSAPRTVFVSALAHPKHKEHWEWSGGDQLGKKGSRTAWSCHMVLPFASRVEAVSPEKNSSTLLPTGSRQSTAGGSGAGTEGAAGGDGTVARTAKRASKGVDLLSRERAFETRERGFASFSASKLSIDWRRFDSCSARKLSIGPRLW